MEPASVDLTDEEVSTGDRQDGVTVSMGEAPEARLRAVVYGRVQGVSFRYHALRAARQLGLTGWVANRQDGAVETVAEGSRAELLRYNAFLERGSPTSYVDRVEINWADPATGEFISFGVRYL